jgi:hypothetical protein
VAAYFVLHQETSASATGDVSGGLIALTLKDQNGNLQIFKDGKARSTEGESVSGDI